VRSPLRFTARRALATLVLIAVAVAGVPAQRIPEAEVKAALIRRLPEFVDWPSSAPTGPAPLTLCFSPSHPFGSVLQQLNKGPVIRGRAVAIRELRKGGLPDACHVLYVASADQDLLQQALTRPILTVGDQVDFCPLGGIVNLRVIDDRVRFEVNLTRARRVGLTLDSQLLRLASRLYGGHP